MADPVSRRAGGEFEVAIKIAIVRLVDESFPGFVECEFADCFGKVWRLVEKGPVVAADWPGIEDAYPRPGLLACRMVGEPVENEEGRSIAEVDTHLPWGIEAPDGTTRFRIFADQLFRSSSY
jgi:hypothetical protein